MVLGSLNGLDLAELLAGPLPVAANKVLEALVEDVEENLAKI